MTKAEKNKMKQVLMDELEKSQAADDSDAYSHQNWKCWGMICLARKLEIINIIEENELADKYFTSS